MQYRVILDGAITIQHYADMSGYLYGMSVVRILTNPIKRLEANHPTDIKMDQIQTKLWEKGKSFALRGNQYHWDIKNRGVYKISKTTGQLTKHGYNALLDVWNPQRVRTLTRWGRVTHICASKLIIIGSENDRRHAIIWTNDGILLIGPLGTIFSEILIEIHTFSMAPILCRSQCVNAKLRV